MKGQEQYLQISDSIIFPFSHNEHSELIITILDIVRLQVHLATLKGVFRERSGKTLSSRYNFWGRYE